MFEQQIYTIVKKGKGRDRLKNTKKRKERQSTRHQNKRNTKDKIESNVAWNVFVGDDSSSSGETIIIGYVCVSLCVYCSFTLSMFCV